MRHTLIVLALVLSGCATVARGPRQRIEVDSTPSGATARLECSGRPVMEQNTPAAFQVSRKAYGCSVTVVQPGYAAQQIALQRRAGVGHAVAGGTLSGSAVAMLVAGDSWFAHSAGAIAAGFGLGFLPAAGVSLLIDASSGAIFKHEPAHIAVTLVPDPPGQPAASVASKSGAAPH